LVEQSLRKREVGGSSPSTGTTNSLLVKFALALASVVAYAVLVQVAETLESVDGFPQAGFWFHHVVGAVFGALVLAPYAQPHRHALRGVALALVSAAIYYLAVRFVVDGPLGYDAVTSFVLAGGSAALLCGLAVVAIGPRVFAWRLPALTLAAGAIGGGAFELNLAFDPHLVVGHAAWQLLVCLALHFSLQDAPT
jgi:hypothetical protein